MLCVDVMDAQTSVHLLYSPHLPAWQVACKTSCLLFNDNTLAIGASADSASALTTDQRPLHDLVERHL